MQKIPSEKIEENMEERKNGLPSSRSRESLWGALLFFCMLLFVVASIASIGWGMYSQWKKNRLEQSEPSISTLLQQTMESENEEVKDDSIVSSEGQKGQEPETKVKEISLAEARKVAISALNGGSAKGSAGVIATFLKGEGYTNVTPGNTVKDYTGTAIYYANSLEKEAEFIKTTLLKKYPQTKILPADVTNKETSVSPITIILGK